MAGRVIKDKSIRGVFFTGSKEVGEHICKMAGVKKVTMELGSNSPLIVMPDADLDKVIKATVASGYSNAGQVCISTQRVLADKQIYADYLEGLKEGVEAIKIGNPIEEGIQLGPMVKEEEAVRVGEWIDSAVANGATASVKERSTHRPLSRT